MQQAYVALVCSPEQCSDALRGSDPVIPDFQVLSFAELALAFDDAGDADAT